MLVYLSPADPSIFKNVSFPALKIYMRMFEIFSSSFSDTFLDVLLLPWIYEYFLSKIHMPEEILYVYICFKVIL